MRSARISFRFFLLTLSLSIALVACNSSGGNSGGSSDASGGSDSDDDSGGTVSTVISGKAAAGAPIQGFIYALDKNGTKISAPIGLDGSYSLDVNGLSAPFIIYARGMAAGQAVELYSYLDELSSSNRTNITPATNFAVASALEGDPAQERISGTLTIPDDMEAEVEDSLVFLDEKLSQVLQAQGVAGVDLRRSDFSANGLGLDALFDTINFQVSSSGSTTTLGLVDKASGTSMLERDAASGVSAVEMTPAQIADVVDDSLSDKAAVEECFRAMFNAQDEATFRALVAPEVVDDGRELDEFIADETSPGSLYQSYDGSVVVSASIIRSMATYSFPGSIIPDFSEHGSYPRGLWTVITLNVQGGLITGLVGFVQDNSGKWLFYGDRCPVEYSEGNARMIMDVNPDGTKTFTSSLNLGQGKTELSDLPIILATGPGIGISDFRSKAISEATRVDALAADLPQEVSFQGGSSTKGLTLYSSTISDSYKLFNVAVGMAGATRLTEADGLNIAEVENNAEYRFIAFDLNGLPKHAWINISAKPIPKAKLTEDNFPRLLTINGVQPGHNLSELALPGSFAATWDNADETWVQWLAYGDWGGNTTYVDNPADETITLNRFDWKSFSTNNASHTTTRFYLELVAEDFPGNEFYTRWFWLD